MSKSTKAQIILKFSNQKSADDILNNISMNGFTSRHQYFLFLHKTSQEITKLDQLEMKILLCIGGYGTAKFKKTPTIEDLSKIINESPEIIKKSLENLVKLEYFSKIPLIEGDFMQDIREDQNLFMITLKGKIGARALILGVKKDAIH